MVRLSDSKLVGYSRCLLILSIGYTILYLCLCVDVCVLEKFFASHIRFTLAPDRHRCLHECIFTRQYVSALIDKYK